MITSTWVNLKSSIILLFLGTHSFLTGVKADGLQKAPTQLPPVVKYECRFSGGAITCSTRYEGYFCCYNPYGNVPHNCGSECGAHGEVSYQLPQEFTTQLTTRNTHMPETTPWWQIPDSTTTQRVRKTTSNPDAVQAISMLVIYVPIGIVAVVMVGVGITWCVSFHRRRKNDITISANRESSTADMENALNETQMHYVSAMSHMPPQYDTVTEHSLLQQEVDHQDDSSPGEPPSYADVVGHT